MCCAFLRCTTSLYFFAVNSEIILCDISLIFFVVLYYVPHDILYHILFYDILCHIIFLSCIDVLYFRQVDCQDVRSSEKGKVLRTLGRYRVRAVSRSESGGTLMEIPVWSYTLGINVFI